MSDSSIYENEPQIQPRNPFARPGPIPDVHLAGLIEEHVPSLVPRDSSSSTSSSPSTRVSSCGPKDTTGPCERSTDSRDNTTLPITLGVIIPLATAFIIMIFLHRRNIKRQRKEDAEDRHKSLDFGLGPRAQRASKAAKKGKKGPEPEMTMTDTRNEIRRGRGLSMDMGVGNPYLLPPGLQHSRESLHSLSRSFNTGDDKYGRTNFIPDDGSIRSPSSLRRGGDDSSSFTGSSKPRFDYESSRTLVQTSTKSGPPTRKASIGSSQGPVPEVGITRKPTPKDNLLAPAPVETRDSFVSTTAFRKSNDYLGAFIRGGGLGITEERPSKTEPGTKVAEVPPPPPKEEVQPPPPAHVKQAEPTHPAGLPSNPKPKQHQEPQMLGLDFNKFGKTPSPPPEISVTEPEAPAPPQVAPTSAQQSQSNSQHNSEYYSRGNSYYGQQENSRNQSQNNSYYGHQQDSRHQSQNNSNYGQHPDSRHQSQDNAYYGHNQYDQQEYDQHNSQQYDQQYDQYYDQYYDQHGGQDYAEEYDDGEDYYDPAEEYSDYGAFAEDYGYDPRRMTMGMRPLPPDDPSENPEQRANRIRSFYKEYFDAPNGAYQGGYDDYYYQVQPHAPRGHSSAGGRHRGHTYSNGSYQAGPRAYSSMSGRSGYPHGRPGPWKQKKPMAAPKALNILPTPSKLKDDTFLLDQAVDFAPPTRAFLQRAGTPDSLRGGQRAYSPAVRAHIPLTSSFDDLSAMPSPHLLRKSGTFTGLDFAAPAPRYREQPGTMSETGSIRSNRSGISAMHQHNIRAGAYRLSRIPKEVAGTKADLNVSLKPKWDMNR